MKFLDVSIILFASDGMGSIHETLAHLKQQSIRDRMELVVVVPQVQEGQMETEALYSFGHVQVVPVKDALFGGVARGSGVRAAQAPIIIFAEDHCFPEPGWAEALYDAHQDYPDGAGIGPVMLNANPESAVSWANFLPNFGAYTGFEARREQAMIAWHNASYPRHLLMAQDEHLESFLETEFLLQSALQAQGYPLVIEPKARVRHVNPSLWRPHLFMQYQGGRHYASARLPGLSYTGRLWSGVAALPAQGRRFGQIMRHYNRLKSSTNISFLSMLPPLLAGQVMTGAGELAGYLFGAGRSREIRFDIEGRRYRYLNERDRHALYPASLSYV